MNNSKLQIILEAQDNISKELQKMQKELKNVSSEMKKMKDSSNAAGNSISRDTKIIRDGAIDAKDAVAKLVGTFKGLGALRLVKVLGALYAVRQAVQLVRSSIEKAMEFDRLVSNINTLFDDAGQSVNTLRKGIEDLTLTIPKSAEELGSAAYNIVSAGINNASDALVVLRSSAILATAGLSTTEESANILTSAINTFGNEGLSVNEISNVLFKTVKAGKTTISELSQAFGATAPIIQSASVTLEDFSAATAALTTTGLPAAQAQNELRAAVNAFLKPSSQMTKVLADMGIKQNDLAQAMPILIGRYGTMGNVFTEVSKSASKNGALLGDVFGSVEALNAVTSLTTSTNKQYVETLKSMTDGSDVLNEAFLKQQGTMSAQWELVKNRLNVSMVELGSKVFPVIIKAVETVTPLFETLSTVIGDVSASVGGELSANFGNASNVLYTFSNLVGAATEVLALGLEVGIWPFIVGIKTLINQIVIFGTLISSVGKSVADVFKGDWKAAVDDMSTGWDKVKTTAVDSIKGIKDSFSATFGREGSASNLSRSISQLLNNAVNGVPADKLKVPIDAILGGGSLKAGAGEGIGAIGTASKKTQDALKSLLSIFQEVNSKLKGFSDKMKEAKSAANDSIDSINKNLKQKLSAISDSIDAVNVKIAELKNAFNTGAASDKKSLAQQFIDAEERVKSLKNELARATDIQSIFDIKQKIKEEEAALNATKDTQKGIAQEISDARSRANMSELEQAIADYNEKRSLAQQEFDDKLAKLEAEKAALYVQREEEKRLAKEKVAEVKAQLAVKSAAIEEEKKQYLQALVNELLLEQGKGETIKQLTQEVQTFRENVTKQASKEVQSTVREEIELYRQLAEQIRAVAALRGGTTKSVNDAIISPQGNIITTHPQDYVIATKNPGSLLGGGGNIEVNINGGTYLSEDVAEQIGDMLVDRLQFSTRM